MMTRANKGGGQAREKVTPPRKAMQLDVGPPNPQSGPEFSQGSESYGPSKVGGWGGGSGAAKKSCRFP